MSNLGKGHISLFAALAAGAIPLSYEPVVRAALPPLPLASSSTERLTKAEKKRARKAAQRLKLASR